MKELISNPVFASLISSVITAGLLYLGRVSVDRRAGDQKFSTELRDDLLEEIKSLKEEMLDLKVDSNTWRGRYWDLQSEVSALKAEVQSLGGGKQ